MRLFLQLTGWGLWGLGLSFALLGAANATEHSMVFVDAIFDATAGDGDQVTRGDLFMALRFLGQDLASARMVGYLFIGCSMAVGTLLIVAGMGYGEVRPRPTSRK